MPVVYDTQCFKCGASRGALAGVAGAIAASDCDHFWVSPDLLEQPIQRGELLSAVPKATVYRSRPEACAISLSGATTGGLYRLSCGVYVTALPIVDLDTGLRARLVRDDAIKALARLGLELPSRDIVLEIAREGHRIEPVTQSFGPEMRTYGAASTHDMVAFARLKATAWDCQKAVMNFGKWHIAGAAKGNNRLCGWSRKDGSLIQEGNGDIHKGESGSLHDYATLTIGMAP